MQSEFDAAGLADAAIDDGLHLGWSHLPTYTAHVEGPHSVTGAIRWFIGRGISRRLRCGGG